MTAIDAQVPRANPSQPLLVDTNLLLILFVGRVDPRLLPQFKRTSQFVPEDYETLVGVLANFRNVVTTPHLLAEVSNLLGQMSGTYRDRCFAGFAAAVAALDERHVPARVICEHDVVARFGLADGGIAELAAECVTLTDDFALYSLLLSRGAVAVNFNHVREFGWQS